MIKKVVFFAFALIPLTVAAQITFEKGYYIDHDGNKVECLIKDLDWKNNPGQFVYKLSEAGESQTMRTSAIQEFGIDHVSRYVAKLVKIDRSSDGYDSLGYERKPTWMEERLLLKLLVEGKGTLYYYQAGDLIRFFYSVDGSPVQQLVYKKYLRDNEVAVNADFRQQLWVEVNCGLQSQNSIKNTSYSRTELVRFFKKYNECNGN